MTRRNHHDKHLGERDADQSRSSAKILLALLAGIAAVALAGPPIAQAVTDQLDQPDIGALETGVEPAPTVAATATVATDEPITTEPTTAPVTTVAPPTRAPVTTSPATTAPPEIFAEPAETRGAEDLEVIQLVPPLRDVIVEIDGEPVASDSSGRIVIDDPVGDFVFGGVRAQPTIRRIALGGWSDGNLDDERELSEVDGPVTELGLVVSHRITIATTEATPDGTEVLFTSASGDVLVDAGKTSWVPATRAVLSDDGYVTRTLTYHAEALILADGTRVELDSRTFEPTPESLWTISTPV